MSVEALPWAKGLEAFLDEARALRTEADRTRRDFIAHLRSGELAVEMWRPAAVTWDDFLKAHDVIDPARYRKELCALELVGAPAETIGMIACVLAARVTDDKKRAAVVAEMAAKAKERRQPLSRQGAQYIVRRHVPPERQPTKDEREAEEIARLREENAALRKENAALRAKERRLQKTIEKLTHRPTVTV